MPRRRKVIVEEQENEVVRIKKADPKIKPTKKQKNQPEWLQDDGLTVGRLVLSVQKSECNNAKVITELTKLYNKVNYSRLDVAWML